MTKRTKGQVEGWAGELAVEHCPGMPLWFKWTRSKGRAVHAFWTTTGKPYGIAMSELYGLNPFISNREIKSAIIHEMARLLSPIGTGRGAIWQANVEKIGGTVPCLVERQFISGSWRCRCQDCKESHYLYREPKYRSYRCNQCGGTTVVKQSKSGRYLR